MKLKKANPTTKPNAKLIPVNLFKFEEKAVDFFNDTLKKCYTKKYNNIIRSPSGGISYSTLMPAFDIRQTKSLIELTVLDTDGFYRIQLRNIGASDVEDVIPGWKCFQEFKKLCLKYGIDLSKYTIDNGKEVKKDIEKYIIKLENSGMTDIPLDNVHHIDFHSAFPSCLVETHPEFTGVITELFNGRKENNLYKLILNATIGYFQSEDCCKARWAHLSKDAINRNNAKLRELASRLTKSGRVVIAFNTDGIWYSGKIYHGKGEGETLGSWANDHTNCKIRFKSAGAYEFIEDGKYSAVVRGHTKLDDIKPREQWEWGDIYKYEASIIKYERDELGYLHRLEVIDD